MSVLIFYIIIQPPSKMFMFWVYLLYLHKSDCGTAGSFVFIHYKQQDSVHSHKLVGNSGHRGCVSVCICY